MNTMVQITALFPGKHKMFLAGFFHGVNGFPAHQLNVIWSPRRREEREAYAEGYSVGTALRGSEERKHENKGGGE